MPYLNTQSGFAPTITGYPSGQQPQASSTPVVQQQAPQDIGSMAGSVLGHLLRSAFPQTPGTPMQLTGANPQTAAQAQPQGGIFSQLLAGLNQQQQQRQASSTQPQQQQPQATGGLLGNTRFVNGLNVVG